MGREELVKVFEDTRKLYEEQDELVEATKQSVRKQKLVAEGKTLPHINKKIYSQPADVVERGASAQEECLCRISNLYSCLTEKRMWEGFYIPHRATHNQLYNADSGYPR